MTPVLVHGEGSKENTEPARQTKYNTERQKGGFYDNTNFKHSPPFSQSELPGVPVIGGIELQNSVLECWAQQGTRQTQDACRLARSWGALGRGPQGLEADRMSLP